MMNKNFIPALLVLTSFVSPLAVVATMDRLKQQDLVLQEKSLEISAKKDAQDARYRYYADVEERRAALKESMNEARQQYDQSIKDQPKAIQDNQKTISQTTVEPVTTQRIVSQPATQSAPKPKSSAKTKTS